MQDNSQLPHPSITLSHISPSSIPLSLDPSTPSYHCSSIHLAVSTSIHFPLFLPSLFFFLLPPFNSISPHHPLANNHSTYLCFPSTHPFFPLYLTCRFSSPLWIIPLIRCGSCNTAVVYNMSVVITDSLAVLD